MRKTTTALAATLLATSLGFAATPAFATEQADPEVWQAWIMPQDSDWDQIVASEENLAALPCGTTWRIQNDLYLTSERDKFVADGILHYGEDFGNEYQRGAIQWYFSEHTTPDCAPEPTPNPDPTPEITPEPTVPPLTEYPPDAPSGPAKEYPGPPLEILPETGPEDDLRFGIFASLGALALIIGGAYIITKRRDDDNLAI